MANPLSFLRNTLPFANSAPSLPTEQLLGHTAPETDPGSIRPRIGVPLGSSGRANFYGLPAPDERNAKLVGTRGLQLLDDMYRTDAHVRRLVLMAWSPIMAGTWTLEPHGGDKATDQDRQIADTIWWALTKYMSPNFFEHLAALGPVLLRSGFCPFEQIWSTTTYQGKQLTLPRKLDIRLPRSIWRWWQDDYGELTYIGQILPNKPDVIIPASELTYYRLAPEGDNWQGTSLLRHCYKAWFTKERLERIDAIGQERKAVGVPVCYPPLNASDQQRTDVETVLQSLHVNEVGYIVSPWPHHDHAPEGEGAFFDVIKFDSSSGDSLQKSLEYYQQSIAASFLGDFMELGHHQVGARATAQVQEDPYLTAVNALAMTGPVPPLNALVKRITELNWPTADGAPEFSLSLHDDASASEIATYVQQLVAANAMQVDPELEDWLRERFGLPPANPDIRQQKLAAQAAGFDQQINPPEPADASGEPPNPDRTPAANPKKPAAAGKQQQLDAAPPPPNLRVSNGDESRQPEHECGTCTMFDAATSTCWGYGNIRTSDEWVCDSWEQSPDWQAQDAQADTARTLDAPSAKAYERLLSQDKLKEALDGARGSVESATRDAAAGLAAMLARQTSPGYAPTQADTTALADAFTGAYEQLYQIGHQTVRDELAKQRKTLKLDAGEDVGAGGGARLARARRRGEHSARSVLNAITGRLSSSSITGLLDQPGLDQAARDAATAQIHAEALTNASAQVNDGRADGAQSDGQVVGGYYTSLLDERACEECILADDGQLLSVDDALALGPPNPDCEGGQRCRCMILWVLSSDPTASGF